MIKIPLICKDLGKKRKRAYVQGGGGDVLWDSIVSCRTWYLLLYTSPVAIQNSEPL